MPEQPANDVELIRLCELGQEQYDRFTKTGTRLHLNAAYDAWRRADARAPRHWVYRPELNYNLGLALCNIASASKDEIVCQQAIDRLRAAFGSGAFNGDPKALVASQLSAAYAEAFNITKRGDHLSEAIKAMRGAVACSNVGGELWFESRTSLGRLLWHRYLDSGESADLLDSLEILTSARLSNKQVFESLPRASSSLCRALDMGAQRGIIGPFLPTAIAIAEEALADVSLPDPARAKWLLALARCLFIGTVSEDTKEAKRRALGLMDERLGLLENDREMGRFLPAIRRMPAVMRDKLFEIQLVHETAAAVDAAIDALPELRAALYADTKTGDSEFQAKWLEGLAAHERYKTSHAEADLRTAASAFDAIVNTTLLRAAAPLFRCVVLQTATEVYFELYWRTGELDLLNVATQIARETYADAMYVKRTIIDTPRRQSTSREALFPIELGLPLFAQTLGLALGETHLRTGDEGPLEEAIKYCREALTLQSPWFHPSHDGGDSLHGTLGSVLRYRYNLSKDESDLGEAIWHHRKAVALSREHLERAGRLEFVDGRLATVPPPATRLASSLNNLGTALHEQFLRTGSRSDLTEAVKCHQEAITLSSKDDSSYVLYVCNLLDDLADSDGMETADIGREALREISETTESAPAHQVLTLNSRIGRLAFHECDWQQAAEGFGRAARARDRLVSIQMRFTAKTWWLSTAQGLTAAHAFALSKLNRLEEAAVVCEAGLATVISSALKWGDVQVDRVRRLNPTLAQRLSEARAALQGLEAPREHWMEAAGGIKGLNEALSRRQAWASLKAMEIEAEAQIGSDEWSRRSSLVEIRQKLLREPGRALVYVATTELGSLALIVTTTNVDAVWAKLTANELRGIVHGRDEKGRSFLDFQASGGVGFDDVLAPLLKKLGESLMGPCADRLHAGGIKEVLLVPAGHLTLLPLHAAIWCASGRGTTLLDEFDLSYLPSAAAGVARGVDETPGSLLNQVIAFGNPRPSRLQYLRSAEAEIEAISKVLRRHPPKAFLKGEATLASFIQSHPSASILHFAGHAFSDAKNPVDSRLVFGNDEVLTVAGALSGTVKPRRGAAAVLSGCQTAVVDSDSLPDESLGLATSLLVTGFSKVVGSLWSVEDRATALLMVRLYELMETDNLSLSQALKSATVWLRDSEGSALNNAIARHTLKCEPFPDDMAMIDRPSLWTAFIHCGAF